MMISLLLNMAVLIAPPLFQGAVTGTVRDGASGRPLSGATVVAVDAGREATTDTEGRYEIAPLPAGLQHLRVRSIGHASYALQAVVPRQGTLELNVVLQPLLQRLPLIQVRRPFPDGDRSSAPTLNGDARTIRTDNLSTHPQLSEPDFLRALAGGDIVVAEETPGGLHVRGGSADQTGYSIDGIPVFNPYHTSDLMGGWNTDAFDRASFTRADGGASMLSGTVQLTSRDPGALVGSRGSTSTTHARFTLDGPTGIRQLGFLVSARAAWPALFASANDPNFVRGSSRDWIGKLESPWSSGTLRFLATSSADGVNLSPQLPDIGGDAAFNQRNRFDWSSAAAALMWQGRVGRDSLVVAGWKSQAGADGSWGAQSARLVSRRTDYGLQATASRTVTGAAFRAGLRLEQAHITYRVDDGDRVASDLRTNTPMGTAFADVERSLGPSLSVQAGAAVVQYGGRGYLSPHVRGRWGINDHLALSGTLARNHQFVQSLRNTESAVGFVFPADLPLGAATGGLPVAQSDEGALSLDFEPTSWIHTRISGYARDMRGVIVVAPVESFPFLRGNPVTGAATAHGVSAEAEVRAEHVLVLARYGVQKIRYRYGDASYTPEFGARALVDGGVTYLPTSTMTARVGISAALGRRVTPASGGIEWESCNLKDHGCEFAGTPGADPALTGTFTAPDYLRVDLGLRKQGHLRLGARRVEVALFGTYSNLLGRFNVLTYGLVDGRPKALEMRPQAPLVIGLDWRF